MPDPAHVPAGLSQRALARLRKPKSRGAFAPIDAARRQLGLLAVADGCGQMRISWLVDIASSVVEDARFLAFGDLGSHLLGDVLCESARGRTVADACNLTFEQLEALLRDDPATPAFAPGRLAQALHDLQARALAAVPGLVLLPKPVEQVAYERKRRQEWDADDQKWLPLSLLKKVSAVQPVVARVLGERLGAAATWSVEGLHDDFRVVVAVAGAADEQLPTVAQLVQDALRAALHPHLSVEAVPAAGTAPPDRVPPDRARP
jgi:NifU-like protein involved in Fe-S cluster formation